MFALVCSLVAGLVIAGVLSWRFGTLWPTMVSYVLHALAAAGIFAVAGLAAPDAIHYSAQAEDLVTGHAGRGVTPGKELFTYLLKLVYSTVGVQPGIIIALNVLLVAAVPTMLGIVAASLRMPIKLSQWAGALVPQTFLWGVLLLRESIIWFAILLCILALAKLYETRRWAIWLPVLVVALVILAYTRGTIAIVLAAAAVIVLLIMVRSLKVATITIGAALVLGMVAVLALPGIGALVAKFSADSGAAARVPGASSRTSSTLFHPMHFGNDFLDLVAAKAQALLNTAAGPTPLDLGHVSIIYFADGLVWVVVLAFAIVGWVFIRPKFPALLLFIPAALILASMAWTLTDYGTLIRLRLMPLLILLPVAAYGFTGAWARLAQRRRDRALAVPAEAEGQSGEDAHRDAAARAERHATDTL